jgi:hypothetical protein
MPNIDLSILNQRQTPAFYASSLATRPTFGFAGRMFIDTDVPSTGIYRDTGSAWVQIADQTGSLTGYIQTQTKWFTDANQRDFTYGTKRFIVANDNPATSGIVPLDTLFINYANDFTIGTVFGGNIGINTPTPGAAIDAHSSVNVIQQLNQTVATNNSLLAFQNAGTGLWRIGNFYNAGANDFGVFDVIGGIEPLRIKKTTGQVLIGTSTVGSGKLVVASATGDNGVQIVGASAPSLRIDNAESGPTKRAGLGISTAANNFIQGSADRDFCMFNGSTTASPILFGIYDTTNVAEAARISAARNFLIGTTTDSGQKLIVNGTAYISGNVGFGTTSAVTNFDLNSAIAGAYTTSSSQAPIRAFNVTNAGGINSSVMSFQCSTDNSASNPVARIGVAGESAGSNNGALVFMTRDGSGVIERARITSGGTALFNTTTDTGVGKVQVRDAAFEVINSYYWLFNTGNSSRYGFLNNGSGALVLNTFGVGNVGSFNMTTGIYTPLSDKNKKKNFENSNLGLDAVLKLKPTLYNIITQKNNEAKELGFIAQEVKEVIKEAYVESGDFIGLNYQAIIATLVKAVQELNTKIENLK